MAEPVVNPAAVDTPAPVIASELAQHVTANGEPTEVPRQDEAIAGPQATTEVNPPDGQGVAEVAQPPSTPAVAEGGATPSGGKKEKKKSIGGVPEHKNKKLSKKKSMPTLHLECKPGDYYWARLKGYPPWPSIICDEQMLPESLLASRPVSTTRPDGSLREDFQEGGKNARERTFPVMFLATNEFTWMVNTSLSPLDPVECETVPAKLSKALKDAYKIAAENHDINYFKKILKTWQEEEALIEKELREQEEAAALEKERKAQAAEDKPKKAKARKSKGSDVEMEDADIPKSSKKRKNESDAEGGKPKKTPKVTKLNAPKTPNGDSATPKKASTSTKLKKKVVQAPTEEDERPQQMTEAERLQQREKTVLYLRHRLQKGFLTRDTPPKEAEMATMAEFFKQLESYDNLEQSIIRTTKIHKVLKGIVKLDSMPDGDRYNFKKRSAALLEAWNKRMEAEKAPATTGTVVVTNGENGDVKPTPVETSDPATDIKMDEGAEGAPKDVSEVIDEAEAVTYELADKIAPIDTVAAGKIEAITEPITAAPIETETTITEVADGGDLTRQPTVEEVPDAAA